MEAKKENQKEAGWGKQEGRPLDISQAPKEDRNLYFGLWYVEHLSLFKKIILGFLVLVSVITWGNFLFTFLYYLAFGMRHDNQMLAEMVSGGSVGHQYFIENPVYNLEASSPLVLPNQDRTSDLIVEIENFNPKYWAAFDWSFASGNEIIESGKSFILPAEKKYILALAEASTAYGSLNFYITNVAWRRIDQKTISDWDSFYGEHLNIRISDKRFISGRELNLSQKAKIDQLAFTAENLSPYNYREVRLIILLKRGGGIVSAGEYTLVDFMSGESREVSINWPGDSGFYTEIEIIPEVNIMDNSVYLKFN